MFSLKDLLHCWNTEPVTLYYTVWELELLKFNGCELTLAVQFQFRTYPMSEASLGKTMNSKFQRLAWQQPVMVHIHTPIHTTCAGWMCVCMRGWEAVVKHIGFNEGAWLQSICHLPQYDLEKDQVQYQVCALGGTLGSTFSTNVLSMTFFIYLCVCLFCTGKAGHTSTTPMLSSFILMPI